MSERTGQRVTNFLVRFSAHDIDRQPEGSSDVVLPVQSRMPQFSGPTESDLANEGLAARSGSPDPVHRAMLFAPAPDSDGLAA